MRGEVKTISRKFRGGQGFLFNFRRVLEKSTKLVKEAQLGVPHSKAQVELDLYFA